MINGMEQSPLRILLRPDGEEMRPESGEPPRYNTRQERVSRAVLDMAGIPYLRLAFDSERGRLVP